MGIDYGLLRNLTAREIISALNHDGFAYERGDGSHQIFYHHDGRRVTVIFPGGGSTFKRRPVDWRTPRVTLASETANLPQ
jgi:predicted RNA binding protein YcfA (HicA-like mRNA interferase family)